MCVCFFSLLVKKANTSSKRVAVDGRRWVGGVGKEIAVEFRGPSGSTAAEVVRADYELMNVLSSSAVK